MWPTLSISQIWIGMASTSMLESKRSIRLPALRSWDVLRHCWPCFALRQLASCASMYLPAAINVIAVTEKSDGRRAANSALALCRMAPNSWCQVWS